MKAVLGRHPHAWALAGLAALAGLWMLPATPAPAADDGPDSVAVVVHLLGAPSPQLPAGAAELRAATLDLVAAILQSRGVTVADRAVTENVVRRHVVRTGDSLDPRFLADLATAVRVDALVAVSLLVQGGRLAATVRAVAATDGTLVGVAFAEAEAGATGEPWQAVLARALKQAVPQLAPPGDGPVVLVLPAHAIGLGPDTARLATASLLAAVLAEGRWRPLDPALAAGAAAAAGCDLERLDSRARDVLRQSCRVEHAVAPEIVSFGETGRVDMSPEAGESAVPGRTSLSEFAFSVRLLDLRTGLVDHAFSAHLAGGPVQGWFGRIDHPGEPARIRAAARRVWSRLLGYLEEDAS
ncbi:MAG: hypothetical protein IPK64_06400 [bacterium]|nr:hypothetical protein [bacterium]